MISRINYEKMRTGDETPRNYYIRGEFFDSNNNRFKADNQL